MGLLDVVDEVQELRKDTNGADCVLGTADVPTDLVQNIWKGWYTMEGNALMLMARTIYVRGDAVTSMEEVQHKVARFHAKYEDEDQDI